MNFPLGTLTFFCAAQDLPEHTQKNYFLFIQNISVINIRNGEVTCVQRMLRNIVLKSFSEGVSL